MDNLRLNTKFIGFDGVIGRRDYFINIALIHIISNLALLPVSWHLFSHLENFADLLNFTKFYSNMPPLLLLWSALVSFFVLFVQISNIIRRANDICGNVNNVVNIILSIILLVVAFGIFLPIPVWCAFIIANLIISLVLIFKKGFITGKYPYDFTKDFNWGAFFGTWLWGLFNKSFKTLWMLILGLTPAGFWYAIICGLKGNEWAYKNKKWESDEKFKRSQDTQTIIFVVLRVIIVPMIYFALIIALIAGLVSVISKEAKLNPDKTPPIVEKLGDFMTNYSSLYFESYEITEKENKFYILPADWAGYSFKDKKDLIDAAATTSAFQRMKKSPKKHFSKNTELPKTKIYSSKNGELLGEFSIDKSINPKDADFKAALKAALTAYKFYRPTVK